MRLNKQQYSLNIDENVHRLHSVLTNMNKKYRKFLRYDEQKLVSVDVKNCQPYIISAILNPQFWNNDKIFSLYSLASNIIHNIEHVKHLPIMIQDFVSEANNQEEFDRYKSLVSSGKFYEEIMRLYKEVDGKEMSRDEAKTTMLSIIFAPNSGLPRHISPKLAKFIRTNAFPKVSELLSIIKQKDKAYDDKKPHARLSCLLQNIESHIILNVVCWRIWEERKGQIPIFTIHDSIVSTTENIEYIEYVVKEEFRRLIGVEPQVAIEEW